MNKFFAVRFLVIQQQQLNAFDAIYEHKQDLILEILKNNPEIFSRNRIYTTRLNIQHEDVQDIITGHFLRSTKTEKIEVTDTVLIEDINNWKRIFFFVHPQTQILGFNFNSSFGNPESIKNSFEKLLQNYNTNSNYKIKLELLVNKDSFWDTISNAKQLYKVAFSLSAPNIFGTDKKANEILKVAHEEHNITSLDFAIENSQGNLQVKKENENEIESYRSQSDDGGGSWVIEFGDGDRKEKISSQTNYRIQQSQVPDELLEPDILNDEDPQKRISLLTYIRTMVRGFLK